MNYRELAQEYWQHDLSTIPVFNKRCFVTEWNKKTQDEILSDNLWDSANGIGLRLGAHSGVLVLDIDILETDTELLEVREKILSMLPPPLVSRRGNPKKTASRFFKFSGEDSENFKHIKVEILTGSRYCVIAPSVHPDVPACNFEWVDKSLLDIDIDDLPTLPSGFIDTLRDLNSSFKSSASAGGGELVAVHGRCMHGSHMKISAYALMLLKSGKSHEYMCKELIDYDARINLGSDFVYFGCPSRKEFKGLSVNEAASRFVSEMFSRNKDKFGVNDRGADTVSADTYSAYVETRDVNRPAQSNSVESVNKIDYIHPDLQGLYDDLGIVTRKGVPAINELTVCKILEWDKRWSTGIVFDDFKACILIRNKSGAMRPILDKDYSYLLVQLQGAYGFMSLKKNTVINAIEYIAQMNTINSCKDYLEGVAWDKIPRVGNFFRDYCGAKDNNYSAQVSHNFWVSMVARVIRPGCKVDNMVVVEGPQGIKKSSMLKAIGGDWYAVNSSKMGDKDYFQNLQGVMLLELGELEGFTQADLNTAKQVVTTSSDKFRAAYARHSQDVKRTCIFVGTTNDSDYLNDPTGGRRYYPIECTTIDLDKVITDRDQLFAEAVYMLKSGAEWWVEPEGATEIQSSRRIIDPWEDAILDWVTDREDFRTKDILSECIKMDIERQTKTHTNKIGKILRARGFEYVPRRVNGVVSKVWRRK